MTAPQQLTQPLLKFILARWRAFSFAFAGWGYVLRTQPHAWIHAFISTVVFFLGVWLELTRYDWALIVIIAVVVWASEFINTALEALVNLASPEFHPLAKTCKDVSAAAVLIAAFAAVIVGLLILGPPLLVRLTLAR